MQYVVQFERSAPAWDERVKPSTDDKHGGGGYIAVTGKLSSGTSAQLDGLKRALEKCVPRARLDLSSVSWLRRRRREGARRRSRAGARPAMELAIQRPEKLVAALEAAVKRGKEGGEGAWLLSLELCNGNTSRRRSTSAPSISPSRSRCRRHRGSRRRAWATRTPWRPPASAVEATGRAPTDQDNVAGTACLPGPMRQQLAQLTGVAHSRVGCRRST